MSGAALHADANVPSRWMLTNFNARGAIGPPLMSYPPKQYVSFTLDGTRYEGFVTMKCRSPTCDVSRARSKAWSKSYVYVSSGRLNPSEIELGL